MGASVGNNMIERKEFTWSTRQNAASAGALGGFITLAASLLAKALCADCDTTLLDSTAAGIASVLAAVYRWGRNKWEKRKAKQQHGTS